MKKVVLFAVLVLLVVGGVAGGISCAATPEDLGLANGRLRPCPDTPNCVNSEDVGLDSFIEPLAYSGDPDDAFRDLLAYLETLPRVEVRTVTPDYAHAVFTSLVFRFRDDVELRLDREAGAIHIRSASRIGYSDLGANRKRVESIRARQN